MFLSKRNRSALPGFEEGWTYFFSVSKSISEKLISPVIDNLGEQLIRLDFPDHENLLNLEEWL